MLCVLNLICKFYFLSWTIAMSNFFKNSFCADVCTLTVSLLLKPNSVLFSLLMCQKESANVATCQNALLCLSMCVSVAAARAQPLFFCTPTVACGTIIFVNATLVTFCQSPERSGPNKYRHGWFCLFCTLFSEHASKTLIHKQCLYITRLEMKPI